MEGLFLCMFSVLLLAGVLAPNPPVCTLQEVDAALGDFDHLMETLQDNDVQNSQNKNTADIDVHRLGNAGEDGDEYRFMDDDTDTVVGETSRNDVDVTTSGNNQIADFTPEDSSSQSSWDSNSDYSECDLQEDMLEMSQTFNCSTMCALPKKKKGMYNKFR